MNNESYISEEDLFELVRAIAKPMTQKEIARSLECSQPAVSQMLSGDVNMLSLALRFLELSGSTLQVQVHTDGKPVRYFKKR